MHSQVSVGAPGPVTVPVPANYSSAFEIAELNKRRQEANEAAIRANDFFDKATAAHAGYNAALTANAHALALWGIALTRAQVLADSSVASDKATGETALTEARAAIAGLLVQKDALGAASKAPGAKPGGAPGGSGGSWWPLGLAAGVAYFLWRKFLR